MRRCLWLLVLIACRSREPEIEAPPDRFAKVEVAPKKEAPPPPPAAAPVQAAPEASAKRKAKVAEAVQKQGTLNIIGSQGGGSIGDVLAGGATSAQPEWPALQGIPVPTTRKFLGAPKQKTLGEVVKWITGALEEHDYEEMGFFRYQDGFAIATRPERIDPEARPILSKRWPQARVHKADEAKSVQALFEVNGEEGDRYRAFVFLCIGGQRRRYAGRRGADLGLVEDGQHEPGGRHAALAAGHCAEALRVCL